MSEKYVGYPGRGDPAQRDEGEWKLNHSDHASRIRRTRGGGPRVTAVLHVKSIR